MHNRRLRHGDHVEVRAAAEILATLDTNGALDGVPFMPEMVPLIGKRFRVDKRADKVCDTFSYLGSREIPNTVLLADIRCNGSGHDGCQAGCRLYWREEWLRPVSDGDGDRASDRDPASANESDLMALVSSATRREDPELGTRYVCQATQLLVCSTPLSGASLRPYIREVTSRNVTPTRFLRVMTRATWVKIRQKLGRPQDRLRGRTTKSPVTPALDLRPGELVRVKSKAEIELTLNDKGMNKGLWFDREMLALSGNVYRVRSRLSRFIEERDGRMIELGSDCITLEGAVCSGDHSEGRWFCPREIIPYWRECWLERVDEAGAVPLPTTRRHRAGGSTTCAPEATATT